MRITVLGGSGLIGSKVSDQLESRGHSVVRASRSAGVDAQRGTGLESALAGADVVVDALNTPSMSRGKATDFFTAAARNVAAAAHAAGVRRIVCLSIHGVEDPAVARGFGYYAAKAEQLAAYEAGSVPVTSVMCTQWFELVEVLAGRASLGPVTVLPTMTLAPLAVDDAARAVANVAEDPDAGPRVTVRGAEQCTALDVARAIVAERGELAGHRPRILRQVPYLGRAIANGGLVPEVADVVVPGGVEDWLRR